VEGATQIKIFGEVYERKIRVAHIEGFSAHADQKGLRDYVHAVRGSVKNVFLVHGEPGPAAALTELLGTDGVKAHYPEWGSTAAIGS
jgi:metallo-beta-lactamase family protein